MRKTKILVIDDDESILDALSLLLRTYGYSVETVYRGETAFKKIDGYNPDIIILDILMSGIDGREICKKIKENENYVKIPIIMISAHPSAETSAKKCGANYFLAKPFEIEDLLSLISKNL